jgi:hypothetical protein
MYRLLLDCVEQKSAQRFALPACGTGNYPIMPAPATRQVVGSGDDAWI